MVLPNDNKKTLKPFLKWAGGKRWLTNNYSDHLNLSYNRYIEPFLGSGAIFFHLNPKKAILTNLHTDLDYSYLRKKLPSNILPAYDGLSINF